MKTAAGFKSFNAFIASQDATYQETTEVNIFEIHVIPDLEDDKKDICTHIPEPSRNMSDSLHNDLEQEMQHKEFNSPLTELTDLPHVIPDDAEPMTLNSKDKML